MKKNIILIDYENVQKHDLRPLLAHDVLIKVFYNKNQKVGFDFLKLAVEFGKDKFHAIQIEGQGKNAADFHIAYFIGKLLNENKDADFHIISRDTGFKPLVDFLNQGKKEPFCFVESSIADMSGIKPVLLAVKPVMPRTIENWYALVVGKLTTSKAQKPKKKKTLRNQIISVCKRKINENDADLIIQKLMDNKIIECKNELIIYSKDAGR
jgi:hypothetical protein